MRKRLWGAEVLQARDFVETARGHGFEWYAGVPCSYLTPFINYVLQDPTLHYVSMANEGDAVALIAGVALAGPQHTAANSSPHGRGVAMMQNSGLGNAVSPLTSLAWTFRIPQLLIVTWRGQPGVADEPQHALMGPITPTLLDTMEIPWELFPTERQDIEPALRRATAHMDSQGRPYAFLMQKGSVAAYPLPESSAPSKAAPHPCARKQSRDLPIRSRPSRQQVLQRMVEQTSLDCAVLATTGFCGRELFALDDRSNQLYMVGSMGCVLPLAIGLALARPQLKVVALDGDGAALMRLGAFSTAGAYAPANLWHLLLDNGVHDSTGGQATVAPKVSFADVAAACGYASALETDDVTRLDEWLNDKTPGPHFARILTKPGSPADLPRPTLSPVEVKARWQRHFGFSRSTV